MPTQPPKPSDASTTAPAGASGAARRRTIRFLVQDPYLQALLFSAAAVGVLALGLIGFKHVADALSPEPPQIPEADLWQEYRLVTEAGEAVADGDRLPVGTIIRLERFAGVESSITGPRLSLSASGDFRTRAPVTVIAGDAPQEFQTPVAWTSSSIREGTALQLRDAAHVFVTIWVPDRQTGAQSPLRFTVGDGAPPRPPRTGGTATDRGNQSGGTQPISPTPP